MSEPTQNARTTKMQVTSVALQTDSCDTLYVTKNTLVTYTIAVVQNSQMLQYEQMHVALQTAQNQASLETPLRVEQLMTTHFNLVVLSNETNTNETTDAQKPETTTVDAAPSTSTADKETYIKIPSQHNSANGIQRGYTLQELSYQPVEENMDSLMAYRRLMKLMILGIRILLLMSQSTPITTPTI